MFSKQCFDQSLPCPIGPSSLVLPVGGARYTIIYKPEHGHLEKYEDPDKPDSQSESTFKYIPHEQYKGLDYFTYVASNAFSDSNIATVSIKIDPDYTKPVKPTVANPMADTDHGIKVEPEQPEAGPTGWSRVTSNLALLGRSKTITDSVVSSGSPAAASDPSALAALNEQDPEAATGDESRPSAAFSPYTATATL